MNKKTAKNCISCNCISFTVVAVILSVLAYIPDMTMEITHVTYLQLFGCTTLIAFLMYFTSKIQVESQIVASLISIFNIAIVVFGVGGGIFRWFPWELKYIAEVAIILILVFIVTNYMMIWQNNELAKSINEKIKAREE